MDYTMLKDILDSSQISPKERYPLILLTNNSKTGFKYNLYNHPDCNTYWHEVYDLKDDGAGRHRLCVPVTGFYYLFEGQYIEDFTMQLYVPQDIPLDDVYKYDLNKGSKKIIKELTIDFKKLFSSPKEKMDNNTTSLDECSSRYKRTYTQDEWTYESINDYYINIQQNNVLLCTLHINHAYTPYPDFEKYKWISGVTFYFRE